MIPRNRNLAIGGAALAIAAGAFVTLRPRTEDAPPPAAAPATPGVVAFAAGAPELDQLAIVTAAAVPLPVSSDLNARIAVDEAVTGRVSSPVAGRITKVVADLGARVPRGAPLLVIDSPDLGQAQSDLAKARADAQLKAQALNRARALFEAQAVARRDVEAAQADAAEAVAERQRAELRVNELGGRAGGESFALRAPVPGVVVDRQVNPGMVLQPGQGPLYTITDPSRLWLLLDVPERDVGRTEVGQRVQFTTDAYPGRSFTGQVARIAPAVDAATRRVQVRATVANPDLALKPEMFARARLVTDDGRTAIAVPNAALVESGVNSYVFVADAPNRFRRVRVTVAARATDQSFISDGLKPGQRVVGEGALLLNAQMAGN